MTLLLFIIMVEAHGDPAVTSLRVTEQQCRAMLALRAQSTAQKPAPRDLHLANRDPPQMIVPMRMSRKVTMPEDDGVPADATVGSLGCRSVRTPARRDHVGRIVP